MKRSYIFLCILSVFLLSCSTSPKEQEAKNGAFAKAPTTEQAHVDRIVNSGELIIATISGPDTYFDHQGMGLGLQYALAQDFAETLGVGVRVELANDTTELVRKLQNGDADLIALQLPSGYCKRHGLEAAGAANAKAHTSWAVKAGAEDLAEALNDWYGEGVEVKVEKIENRRYQARNEVRRTVRAPYISRERGIISTYDRLFKEAARYTGWDWRLIAAQCYQESGFDPNAISWAGAKGLMQIMPSTAQQLGLPANRVFEPTENIAAAARLIRRLQAHFADVPDRQERMKFVLASYNGGQGHIRDAQALARKYGGNPHSWEDVSYYVRGLSQPRYYRDPAVRYGYMIGSETAGYVESIVSRWKQYGGNAGDLSPAAGVPHSAASAIRSGSGRPVSPHKRNRYSSRQRILSADELEKGL